MPPRENPVTVPSVARGDQMVRLELQIPASWKRWLEEAARARALSVGAIVRLCIRDLMLQRPRDEKPAA